MDTPTNLAVITGVITLSGRVDIDWLKNTLGKRLIIHKRFRQRVGRPDAKCFDGHSSSPEKLNSSSSMNSRSPVILTHLRSIQPARLIVALRRSAVVSP